MKKRGNIRDIIERKIQGKDIYYSCVKTGRTADEAEWIPLVNLQAKEKYLLPPESDLFVDCDFTYIL